MSKLLRKLRGLLGVGLTWGTLWAGIGAAIGLVIRLVAPPVWGNPIGEWALGIGLYGVVSGFAFATLLSLREGRKTLLELSLKRVALWGVLGAAAVPLVFAALGTLGGTTTAVDILESMLVTASLGGAFAAGSVAIARRAELSSPDRRALLE